MQVASAVNCTKPAATHILLAFVTFVLSTPCRLINAPEIIATINPAIRQPPLTISIVNKVFTDSRILFTDIGVNYIFIHTNVLFHI